MKKTLILSAVALAATIGVNAEKVEWDFANHGYFLYRSVDQGDPNDPFGFLPAITKDGYDFIKNTGATTTEDEMLTSKDDESKWHGKANRVISLVDGETYCLTEDPTCLNGVIPAEYLNQPFIGWGDKGPTRTRWMVGWGSLDAWVDADYNGATESDWVATKHALSFLRNGNSASRTDTYVQFPAVKAPCTVTVWCGTTTDSRSKNQNINVKITPVVNGVADADNAVVREKLYTDIKEKRMYKMDPVYFDGTGDIAFQIGANGYQLQIYHVTIETGTSGIEDIIANPETDENAPIYNVLGVQVDENYKGIVIKNGKKYIQK